MIDQINKEMQKIKDAKSMILDFNKIHNIDCIKGITLLNKDSIDIIIADPPYNINKNFGNNKTNLKIEEYINWSKKWIKECIRVLKPNGTMFIYGFSEILSYLFVNIELNKKWLIWHYTNKTTPSLNFWQRSHESIICCWKNQYKFNKNLIREPYSKTFSKIKPNKIRVATKGRFSNGIKETTYNKHPLGALPRDVIKVPALAGGAGKKEKVNHPTQKPLKLSKILINSCLDLKIRNKILIPFAGSGTECLASKMLNQDFISFELNEEYIKIANARLQEEI